mmetsp:Transcript_8551/g.21898  ORF Transcript_8551/g.21898 Transcript_8551/m.21898 type:complete len:198 (-) Transcript_8551:518-1111(-)
MTTAAVLHLRRLTSAPQELPSALPPPTPAPPRFDRLQPGTRVMLQRLQARQELNGQAGRVEKFIDDKGRYNVRLEGENAKLISVHPHNLLQMLDNAKLLNHDPPIAGTIVDSRDEDDGTFQFALRTQGTQEMVWVTCDKLRLPNGTLVRITGLRTKPALNGSSATIDSWDDAAGRYVVARSATEKIKLRPVNVTIMQ